MTLEELAERINAHLQKFPRDRFPGARAAASLTGLGWGERVRVVYDNRDRSHPLTKDEAQRYLAWLDAGNVGTHFDMER